MSILGQLRKALITAHPLFAACASCPDNHIPWQAMRRRLPEPAFPVDIVFTWVDGADPALVAKKARFLPDSKPGSDTSLFRDNGELRFALRSIERYAPWARRIFIVTDGQVPAWLNPDHPKIRIVDHTECIPEAYLPTFNSRIIESHLHRIPGLAEHFIYCNDDFFCINGCTPGDFFTANGIPYVFTDWRNSRRLGYTQKNPSPHAVSYHNARAWLARKGILPTPDIIVAHAPYPMTVSSMRRAYLFYEDAVNAFARNKFRNPTDIVFPCHAVPLLAYAEKRTAPRDMPFYYINAKRFDRLTYYGTMLWEKDQGTLPPFLCLNDVGEAPEGDTWREDMQAFLRLFFPTPSSFERKSSLPEPGESTIVFG